MSDIIEQEILSLLGRMAGELDDVKRVVYRMARHHQVELGDKPRTFHVQARKVDNSQSQDDFNRSSSQRGQGMKFGEFEDQDTERR